MSDGSSQVVAVGLDDAVYHTIRYAGGAWQSWHEMAGYNGAGRFQGA
jgi:hypothetical protein